MVVKRRDMGIALMDIANKYNPQIPIPFIEQVSAVLKKEYNITLSSTLSELVYSRLSKDAEEGFQIANLANDKSEDNAVENQTDEEFWEQVGDMMKKDGDPEFSILRTTDDEIKEIQYKYARKIAPHRLYLQVSEWDLSAISFYCTFWGYDPPIEQLLFFLFPFENQDKSKSIGADEINKTIDDMDKGLHDANNLSDLIHEKQLENDQREFNGEFPKDIESLMELIHISLIKNKQNSIHNSRERVLRTSSDNTPTYFELAINYNKLKGFKSELERHGYIAKDFPMEIFKRVFLCRNESINEKLKQQPLKPIEWLTNKSHLGYLIKQLSKHNIIDGRDYYKIAESCFLYKGEAIPNTTFHGMQLPADPAKMKISKIVLTLK